MSLVQRDKIFDRPTIDKTIALMQEMVSHYVRLNVGCHKLRFYIPDYFAEQLIFHYQDHAPKGVKLTAFGLSIWGTEVQSGYENKVILFCPTHTTSSHSPILEISRFGRDDMYVFKREK